jgi:hypothetical protein
VVTQTPYSPASVPYTFLLFREVKLLSRGLLFEDVPEILKKSPSFLLAISRDSSSGDSCRDRNSGKMAQTQKGIKK